MLWNFARLMRSPPRVVEPEEVADDAPPERFTQKISDEGGDVYLAPVLDALRAALARGKRAASEDASPPAPEGATLDERTEAAR
ncbi:MAG TPA: hypothetical protein VM582_01635 [Candidatus Thermoplasmatota archaeon]|nr:hypothetical protein [Candidatus Thermoplasmatota archaeon]